MMTVNNSIFDLIQAEIHQLSINRDKYFLENPTHSETQKQNFLNEKIQQLKCQVENADQSNQFENENKAKFFYLLGKILNLTPDFDAKCEEHLSKAVKLNPQYCEAWNELCECLCKKPDYLAAKNCLIVCLKREKTKVTLKSLSMLIRRLDKSTESIKQSLAYAEQAVDLDTNDGASLYNLANANFISFFTGAQISRSLLIKALDFYEKALKAPDEAVKYCSDLYYNKGTAHLYEEQYQQSLNSFQMCLRLEPNFECAKELFAQLNEFLLRIYESIIRKGKQKPQKLKEITTTLQNDTLLGQLANYKWVKSIDNDLKFGFDANLGCVFSGIVVSAIFNPRTSPYTFCLVDQYEQCCCVTVYNFDQTKFGVTIGQTVAILDPQFDLITVVVKEKKLQFASIRVQHPRMLIVNGKRCSVNECAAMEVKVEG